MAREYWLRFFLKKRNLDEDDLRNLIIKFDFPYMGATISPLPKMAGIGIGGVVIFFCESIEDRERMEKIFLLAYSDNISRCDHMKDARPWIQSEKDYK